MKISQIILVFFALVAIIFELYLGIFSFVGFFIQVILVAMVAAIVGYSVSSSPTKSYRAIFLRSALIMTAMIGLLVAIVSGFITYHNVYPAALSDITLTDGSGTVVFVQMSHIANGDFYRQKNTQLQSLAQSGYTILLEGVRPGSSESQSQFDRYMGFQFTETLYKTIALLTGFEAQNNETLYAGISTGSLTSVDISIDEIVSLIGDSAPLVSGEVIDIERDLSLAIQNTTEKDKKLLNYAFRGFLNWTLKGSGDIESALMEGEKAGVFRAIIEKRNDPIVEYIRTHPGDKIAIVYGSLHFNGVYEGLQGLSPAWKILHIEHTYPYR